MNLIVHDHEGEPGILKVSSEYKIKNRDFKDISQYFSHDYRALGTGELDGIAYSGAEHEELPNATVIPNWITKYGLILGTTQGHQQGVNEIEIQEIYEFLTHGIMVINRKGSGKLELHLASPGSRVLVPSFCSMTLYNTGLEPMVTWDYSNSELNKSTKHIQEDAGPVLCFWMQGDKVFMKINREYINRNDGYGLDLNVERDDLTPCDLFFGFTVRSQSRPGTESEKTMRFPIELFEDMQSDKKMNKLKDFGIEVITPQKTFELYGERHIEPLHKLVDDNRLQRHFKMPERNREIQT